MKNIAEKIHHEIEGWSVASDSNGISASAPNWIMIWPNGIHGVYNIYSVPHSYREDEDKEVGWGKRIYPVNHRPHHHHVVLDKGISELRCKYPFGLFGMRLSPSDHKKRKITPFHRSALATANWMSDESMHAMRVAIEKVRAEQAKAAHFISENDQIYPDAICSLSEAKSKPKRTRQVVRAVSMDTSDAEASRRVVMAAARDVISQHRREIEALVHK